MKVQSFYPVLMSEQVSKLSTFYREHFGFETTFESDGYVSLRQPHTAGIPFELALLDPRHSTVPKNYGQPTTGVILNIEVEDAQAVYEHLMVHIGLPEVLSLRDEDFGQRHFMTRDPDGTLIDVIENIEPSAEFAQHYVRD